MNQHEAGLVHDDVLAKMDALLKKHHDALARGSVVEDFPVLTDVVKEEDVIPVLTEVVEVETEVSPVPEDEVFSLGDEGLDLLDRRVQEMLDQHLPSRIAEAVDKMFPAMLEQLSRQVENMLRDAVAQEVRQQVAESLRQGHHDEAPE